MKGIHRGVQVATVIAILSACSSSPPPLSATDSTVPSIEPGVPISHASPIPKAALFHSPPESPESALGPTAAVLDQAANDLFLYDQTRRRFLGPAEYVVDSIGSLRLLPGYPFIGDNKTNYLSLDACQLSNAIIVAGGGNGTVTVFPRRQGTLGRPYEVSLPVVPVVADPSYGGGPRSGNGSPFSGKPDVYWVVCTTDHHVIAITEEQQFGSSVAYLLSDDLQRVATAMQLPGGTTGSVASLSDGTFVIGTNRPSLTMLSSELAVRRDFTVASQPLGVAVTSHYMWVQIQGEIAVYDLQKSQSGPLITFPTIASPAVITASHDNALWAGNFDSGLVREYRFDGGVLREAQMCPGLSALTETPDELLGICRGHPYAKFAALRMLTGELVTSYGGGDPIVIAPPPP